MLTHEEDGEETSDLPEAPKRRCKGKHREEDSKVEGRMERMRRLADRLQVETDEGKDDDEEADSPEIWGPKGSKNTLATASVEELKEKLKSLQAAKADEKKQVEKKSKRITLLETLKHTQGGGRKGLREQNASEGDTGRHR